MAAALASIQENVPPQVSPHRGAAILAWGYPVLLWGSMIVPWLCAWAILGHMPRPSVDDPKDVLGLFYSLTLLPILIMPIAMVAALYHSFTLLMTRSGSRVAAVAQVVVLVAYWVASIWICRLDPLGITSWLAD